MVLGPRQPQMGRRPFASLSVIQRKGIDSGEGVREEVRLHIFLIMFWLEMGFHRY